ncbi:MULTISPECIES: hypothetical protein [Bradyrhizobium]|uniref:hypothetical protein n=1 Tax=Bradyrhizobium elkanii TaxID=29448 RepID=UPI000429D527|nr:hypothetical protein [Bradyrhizobium elkanii]
MPSTNPHVLIEMTDEPDCHFIGSWLIKVAEAQALWSEALRDRDFHNRVSDVCAFCEPSLECAALEILCELKRRNHVLATDLKGIEPDTFSFEFGMMVQLGLFTFNGRSYQITVPEAVAFESVQQAALNLLATARDVGDGMEAVQAERLLHTLPEAVAEAWRSRLIAMRRFNADPPRGRTVQ